MRELFQTDFLFPVNDFVFRFGSHDPKYEVLKGRARLLSEVLTEGISKKGNRFTFLQSQSDFRFEWVNEYGAPKINPTFHEEEHVAVLSGFGHYSDDVYTSVISSHPHLTDLKFLGIVSDGIHKKGILFGFPSEAAKLSFLRDFHEPFFHCFVKHNLIGIEKKAYHKVPFHLPGLATLLQTRSQSSTRREYREIPGPHLISL